MFEPSWLRHDKLNRLLQKGPRGAFFARASKAYRTLVRFVPVLNSIIMQCSNTS